MKRFCCLIYFVLISLTLSAQNTKIDSLKSALNSSSKHDDYKILWGLAFELFDVDNPQALEFATKSHSSALVQGDTLYIVRSARLMGQLLRRLDRLYEGESILLYVLPIAKRHNEDRQLSFILNTLAVIYLYKAEYDKALDFQLQSLYFLEVEKGPKSRLSSYLNNVGLIYLKLENYELALDYFKRAVDMKKITNSLYDLDRLYINLGLCYSEQSKPSDALECFKKALSTCAPNCSSSINIEADYSIGYLFFRTRKLYLAKLYFEKSLNLSIVEDNHRFQFENLIGLLEISLRINNIANSKRYLNQIEQIPDKDSYGNLMLDFYRLSSNFFVTENQFERAFLYQQRYAELLQKLFDSKIQNNLLRIQTQYAERENLNKIQSQAKILALQQKSIESQRLLNYSFIVISLLIIWLVVILFRKIKEKQRLNELLDLRVRERTFELELNRDHLQHAHTEQALILKKVSNEMTASLATIKGLSSLPTSDLEEGKAFLFKEAESMAEKVIDYINTKSALDP